MTKIGRGKIPGYITEHEHERLLDEALDYGTKIGKVIPPDDDAREAIWHEIQEAWPQLCDAMLSRLNEILWPNGITKTTSFAFKRPTRFYPDPDESEEA